MNTQTTNPKPAVRNEGNGCDGAMFAEHIIDPKTEQVTTFVEAGDTNTVIANTPQRGQQLTAASEKLPETTSGILERPYRITTFKWSQEQTINTTLFDGELFSRWLANPNFSRVLSLYEYVRADFTILIQVNAQAFNAGLLCGAAYPRFGSAQFVPNCTRNIRGLSGMNSLRLDIADETSTALAVNWFSPTSHMRTLPDGNAYSEWLGFRLAVYAPLTGAGDVDVTIWLTARNVELAMPRGITRTDPPEIGDGEFPGEDESGEIQSAGAEAAEASVADAGSNAVRQVQEAARTAATWWTTISSIFVALGLSKPRLKEPTMRMQPNVMADMGAGDGVSAPKMLAVFMDNAIDTSPIRSLDAEDPHIIANIVKRPCYLTTVRWLAQDQPERVIATIRNGLTFEPDIPGVGAFTYARSWLAYFAQVFRFWHGSITYRIHVVKTKFHSGRLEVSFVPFATTSLEDRDHTNAFRAILDIRQASVFDVTIPYVFPTELISNNRATGTLYIKVVNDLVVGGGAAPYVDIVVERFSRDATFAVPQLVPRTDPGVALLDAEEGPVQLCEDQIVALDLFPKRPIQPIQACACTVGEVITDLRQLMKRYLWMYSAPANDTLKLIRPFNGPAQHTSGPNVEYEARDYMGAFCQLFGFMTGGVRWLFIGANQMGFTQDFDAIGAELPIRATSNTSIPNGGATVYKTSIEPMVEVQVPYYARTPFVQSAAFPTTMINMWRGKEWVCTQIHIGQMQEHEAYRSVAEDFTFGLLLGPPETQA